MAKVFKGVVIIFGFLPFSSPVMHSLQYFDTATFGVRLMNISEFFDIKVVDGEVIASYDSISQNITLKTDLANTVNKDAEIERAKNTEESLKAQIEKLKKGCKQPEGVHVYQRRCGCQWNDEDDAIGTYEQYGYNGEDFLSLNVHQMSWIAAVPEAVPCRNDRNKNKAELQYLRSFLTQDCIDRLKKYVKTNALQPTVPPEVSLLQDSSSSEVVCHATGFYPDEVTITWKRDGVKMQDHVDEGETLPNHDRTFQKRSLLTVSPEERKESTYTCEVYHLRSKKSYIKTLIEYDGNTTGIIIGVVVAVLVLIAVIAGVVFMRTKRDYKKAAYSDSDADGSGSLKA